MSKSKVYFTDLRTKPGNNLLDKLERLVKNAGIENIDFKNKFAAIKIHFGEPGNLAFIRPNYAAKIVKLIKDAGGIVYLTDANTLYNGQRANAIDHLRSAYENGFNPLTVGCNIVIADGLRGFDYREVEINCKNCKTAMIASGIAEADIVISMNHFKGHEMTGFGGALKNLGMGSGSRGGKMDMHSGSKPYMNKGKCISCGMCLRNCSQRAISFDENRKADIDLDKCIGCGQCTFVCQHEAACVKWEQSADICNEKIAEYAYAVVKDKPNFHINFIMNVSPDCDCFNLNDAAIVPDIGIAASFDPVALDVACAELVNNAPAIKGSVLDERHYHHGEDKFKAVHSNTDWNTCLDHAQELGLGTKDYEIVVVK